LAQVTVKANHQVEVFTDRAGAESAHTLYQIAAKDAECSGNDGKHIEVSPSFAADQESPQVFDDLQHFNGTTRQASLSQPPSFHHGAIQHTHNSTNRDHTLRLGQNRDHNAQQSIRLKNRIRIHHANVRTRGCIQACIDGIGLTASGFLVEHHESRLVAADIDSPNGGAPHLGDIEKIGTAQGEPVGQFFESTVARTIINDNQHQFRILQGKQRFYRLDDRRLFIVCGNQNRDRGSKRRVLDVINANAGEATLMNRVPGNGCDQQKNVNQIRNEVVIKQNVVGDGQEMSHGETTSVSSSR